MHTRITSRGENRASARARPRRRGAGARGVTLLEVVCAVMILGLVTSSIAGSLAFMFRQERNEDHRLAAYELANRILLQYLDDETVVKRIEGRPLDYGTGRFRWEYSVQRFTMKTKEAEVGSGRPRGGQYKDRFEYVTVRVWLDSDAAHGKFAGMEEGPEPLATLSRMLDPSAVRNNDAMVRLGKDQQRLMDMVKRMGIVQGAPEAPAAGGAGDGERRDGSRRGSRRGREGGTR